MESVSGEPPSKYNNPQRNLSVVRKVRGMEVIPEEMDVQDVEPEQTDHQEPEVTN